MIAHLANRRAHLRRRPAPPGRPTATSSAGQSPSDPDSTGNVRIAQHQIARARQRIRECASTSSPAEWPPASSRAETCPKLCITTHPIRRFSHQQQEILVLPVPEKKSPRSTRAPARQKRILIRAHRARPNTAEQTRTTRTAPCPAKAGAMRFAPASNAPNPSERNRTCPNAQSHNSPYMAGYRRFDPQISDARKPHNVSRPQPLATLPISTQT